jgi:ribosomal protein S18 acetylase RimI-like enzyme
LQNNWTIRSASVHDQVALDQFLNAPDVYSIHHLDWHLPVDWLGNDPFLLLVDGQKILAALAMPADPPEISWVRLFACSSSLNIHQAWQELFSRAIGMLFSDPDRAPTWIAGLAFHPWFENLLAHSGFHHYQDIVVLNWEKGFFSNVAFPPQLNIRPMLFDDLPAVVEVDHHSFEPIWQLSESTLNLAYRQSRYATVLLEEDQIIGYQMSSISPYSAHLARLAVTHHQQRKGLGISLVKDLFRYCLEVEHIEQISVNTQSNNTASLNLYHRMGFIPTGETFAVFTALTGQNHYDMAKSLHLQTSTSEN